MELLMNPEECYQMVILLTLVGVGGFLLGMVAMVWSLPKRRR